MKKSTLIDQSQTPDGRAIALFEHDGNYSIRIDGLELMSTRQHASEERLAELACAGVKTKREAAVLIGGLGFGFTLRAALTQLSPDATVTVAELMPAVVEWNKNPAYKLAADVLADRRVKLVLADVAAVIGRSRGAFDAILLDVDNGPAALSAESNEQLYDDTGLYKILGALKAGGVVAFWSASADPRFAKRLAKAGFEVDVQRARAHVTSGGWHTLFLGRSAKKSGR